MEATVKILFIDREEGEYLLLADLLSRIDQSDYELMWHERLDGALSAIFADNYDLVLLDYYWGEETARDLLSAAKTQACTTPIVVMTHKMETEVDREAIRAGAADYLIKGQIDTQLLERTLRYAIERKQTEQHLSRLAHYDTLTDIPNRILFRDRLEHALRLADRDEQQFALMFIDLNGFKQVNDSFGHDVGDQMIRACAGRLKECMRRSDSVARMGGDEFTLLLEKVDNNTDVAHIAQKVVDRIEEPYQLGGYQMTIGCSIGIAIYPDAGRDADSLLKSADLAMYEAKQHDDSSYQFFTDTLNREVRRQLHLESDLRQALKSDQLHLEYQPRIDIASGRIVAVEALLRWQHPTSGLLDAKEFIGIAEDTGLINDIGYWIVDRACQDLCRVRGECCIDPALAINFSVRQFRDDQLVQRLASILNDWQVPGQKLELELTEAGLMENLELISLCMRPLNHLGISFALDDFGSGFCSLLHLQRLPIRSVKIDSQFVASLEHDDDDQTLVRAMINLAHELDKTVVAEGVETDLQKTWLAQAGCDQLQGYQFCAPQTADKLCRTIKSWQLV